MNIDLTDREARLVQFALWSLADRIAGPYDRVPVEGEHTRGLRDYLDPAPAANLADAEVLELIRLLANRMGDWKPAPEADKF